MDRRKFLHFLLGGAAVALAPKKLIFDVGANLWQIDPRYTFIKNFRDMFVPLDAAEGYNPTITDTGMVVSLADIDHLDHIKHWELHHKAIMDSFKCVDNPAYETATHELLLMRCNMSFKLNRPILKTDRS